MINERHEELAALAALDLLDPAEQAELTAALVLDPGLQTLIDSLRETAAALAHTAPSAAPPATLKARLLANIAVLPVAAGESKTQNPSLETQPRVLKFERPKLSPQVLEFPNPKLTTQNSKPSLSAWSGWLAAACLALAALWLGQNYFSARKANQSLRDQQTLADLTLRSAQNQLEAERLIAKREIADAAAKLSESSRTLATLQARVDAAGSASVELTEKLAAARTALESTRSQLADARTALSSRDQRLAELDRQLKTQGDLANYKIAAIASLAGNSPQALAVAVWNPANQQGVLSVKKLPALAADRDYQLWVFDEKTPVSGGTFTVDPVTGEARVDFRPARSIKSAQQFAISLERKGGSSQPNAPDGPVQFLGQ
jgi:anti-sigma-K factor RskA